jgi:hypothetical protein
MAGPGRATLTIVPVGIRMSKSSLTIAISKLAIAGEQAGLSVEEIIEVLESGVRVETLFELIALRLEGSPSALSPTDSNLDSAIRQLKLR